MAIFIAEPREPLTASSSEGEYTLAESDAYHRLRHDIERYARGEVSGRSYLISGHRGSGKTTMVLKAIEDAGLALRKYGPIRPLLVRLNGPDLLQRTSPASASANSESQSGSEVADATEDSAADKKKEDEQAAGDTQQVLIELTKAIYRAAADHFAQAYDWRCRWELPAISGPRRADLIELGAQLRLELDRTPDLAMLREMWRRVRALDDGVLFPDAVNSANGMRELIALSSSAQAYRIVSGKLNESEKQTTLLTGTQSLAVQTVTEIKNALNPLFGLLAGGLVGVGLEQQSGNGFLATLAGTATGLAVTFSLSYAGSRSSARTRSRESNFLPDRRITSLSRTLPVMVERFREAGVALIFVVDELDKVEHLSARMENLVRNLKQFVTERAFFCFLTDRDYLEQLRSLFITEGYPKEHTYFSDRIFVLYRPANLHKYLSGILLLRSAVGQSASATEAIDHLVLPYILLHRSRMHQFDLRRQIARMRDEQGLVPMKPGDIASLLSYRFDLLIQLAIEWLLDQQALRERLLQDEDFAQLTYDALYYPSRMWERGEPELKVSRAEFHAYLEKRMSPASSGEPTLATAANASTAQVGVSSRSKRSKPPAENGAVPVVGEARKLLSPLDEELLYKCLRQLIAYLETPMRLYQEIVTTRPDFTSVDVLNALPRDLVADEYRYSLLHRKSLDVFTWRYDLYGRSVNPLGVESILSKDLDKDKTLIRYFESLIADLSGNRIDLNRLAVDYSVLRKTPPWPQVADALRRLDRLASTREPYPDMEQDANHVWEYARMLRASASALVHAFVCASLLGRLIPGNLSQEKLVNALRRLSAELLLESASEEDTLTRLSNATSSLTDQLGLSRLPLFREDDLAGWGNELRAAMLQVANSAAVSPANVGSYRDAAIDAWHSRFGAFLADRKTNFTSEATAEDLLWAASDQAVPRLRLDLADMTIKEWTELLRLALSDRGTPGSLPSWFAIPTLVALGFSGFASDCAIKRDQWIGADRAVESEVVRQWAETIAPQWNPGVLILVQEDQREPAGITARWKPSARYASLWSTVGRCNEFVRLLTAFKAPQIDLNRDLGVATVMLEVLGDDQTVMKTLGSPRSKDFPVDLTRFQLGYVISRSLPRTSSLPVISAPMNLDEAMVKLSSMAAPSPGMTGTAGQPGTPSGPPGSGTSGQQASSQRT